MRIHSDNTDPYIQSLAIAANKDPLSLNGWRCLHVTHVDGGTHEWYENVLTSIKQAHTDADCDVVHCSDDDILFISHNLADSALQELANEMGQATLNELGKKGEATLYSLMHDWRRINDLLINKAPTAENIEIPTVPYNFGEISALKEVFEEARKRRQTRAPLHVLVVEDDPLTRRIITNSFKQDYALITASTAQEAIAHYLMHAPDIVFLDIGLPDTTGFHVLHQIMTSDPKAYVVMFSGNHYLENVIRALGAGACGFIAKPFQKDLLKHYITTSASHHAKQIS